MAQPAYDSRKNADTERLSVPKRRGRSAQDVEALKLHGTVGAMQDKIQRQMGASAVAAADAPWSMGQSIMLIGGVSAGLWAAILAGFFLLLG